MFQPCIYMTITLLRFIACLAGLSGFGIIVANALKKWELIGKDLGSIWIVAPILILFLCGEVSSAPHIRKALKLSSRAADQLAKTINLMLIIVSILATVSIPFLWFGIIEDLAKKGGG